MNNLASLLQDQGQSSRRRCSDVREVAGAGRRSPDTPRSRWPTWRVLQDQGQLEEAAPLYRRDLEASELTLGADHPDTLALANLRRCCRTRASWRRRRRCTDVPGGERADAGR